MTRTMIAAALFATTVGGSALAGEHPVFSDADRAFYADASRSGQLGSVPSQAPRQHFDYRYRGGFGSFGGAAGTAHTLGY